MTQYVLLSADTTKIVAVFGGPQPSPPNYAVIEDTDSRYLAYLQIGLVNYATTKLNAIANGGITVNVASSGSPVNMACDTSADGKANLSGILAAYAGGALTGNYTWYQSGGSLSLTQAQIQSAAAAVLTFVSSVYATWQAVLAAIAAGTITTTAQIDTPPSGVPAWPANS